MENLASSVSKTLSANDLGRTGSHQAGILVPKDRKILDFFPALVSGSLNPRVSIKVVDEEGQPWQFQFIHYNNRVVACGTRNEYRLTCMTKFLRKHGAQIGDTLFFEWKGSTLSARVTKTPTDPLGGDEDNVIRLSGEWRVVRMRTRME